MSFTYIDLFAGIGGFHQAMKAFGGTCLFASEWDKYASDTYYTNYQIRPYGDITKIEEKDIPPHDILCAGFPCQAFSISGKQRGFLDTRGTLFFEIARIVAYHHPKVLFLENVKNLVRHDEGRTLATILRTLDELGYETSYQILNTSHFGLPQNRERIYIVALLRSKILSRFVFPKAPHIPIALNDILEYKPQDVSPIKREDIQYSKQIIDEDNDIWGEIVLPNRPIQIGKVGKGGQGERIYDPRGHAITLSAYGGGVGSKTGLYQIGDSIRKLSPRECARLQGFPEDFIIHPSKSQAYKQFGNSVSVNVLKSITAEIIPLL